MNQPSVALIVANRNGSAHLPAFLDSVAALDYSKDRLKTIVVDNASTDGSRELLAERYPWVHVLAQEDNLGFAEAVNVGARAASAECLVFANNDMRLDRVWLRELVRLYAPQDGYPCVGGLILDWERERVDFVDAHVTFHGAAARERFGQPLAEVRVQDGRELPFACGSSMLIDRELFLELGGFDPAFFAFFEDVDLGWRLWLSGYKVRLAANARSYHHHHGTAGAFPAYQRQLLLERNALLMLVKNLGDANLARLLAPSLLLLVERAVLQSGSPRAAFEPGAPSDTETEMVPRTALAGLHAVADVLATLEQTIEKRKHVQALRRRSDAEVFALFRRPFAPVRTEPEYLEAMVKVREAFRLDELFPERRTTRLLVVADDGSERLSKIAHSASRFTSVTRASPAGRAEALDELFAEADVVLIDGRAPEAPALARRARGLLVVDLDGASSPELLELGDVFICSSQEERDRWTATGALQAPIEVVAADDDATEPLRVLVEEPWRRPPRRRPPALPEDAQTLLARWRHEYGVDRPAAWHIGRALWRALPESARRQMRRLLQRG